MSSDQCDAVGKESSPQNSPNQAVSIEERPDVPGGCDTNTSSVIISERDAERKADKMGVRIPTTSTGALGTSQGNSDAVASTSGVREPKRLPSRKRTGKRSGVSRKKAGGVNESGTDSYMSSDSDLQIVESMEVLDPEIDNKLEENASKNRLNAINVKNILREVLTNEQVVSMLRNSLQFPSTEADRQSPEPAAYELRMTRSKVKKVLTEEKVPKPWPVPLDKRPSFLDLEFPDDEEDDEYEPEEETIDEENEVESEVSTLQIDEVTEEEPTVEGDDIIATRTRSKLPMTGTRLEEIEEAFVAPDITADMYETQCDDSEWQDFLAELAKTDPVLTSVEAVEEDPNDPDFNYLAAPENEDDEDEDFKFEHFDRPFRVSKMELNQLIDDFKEWFPDEEDELLPVLGKSPQKKSIQVERTSLEAPSTSTPSRVRNESNEVGEETLQRDPTSSIPVLTADQRETLKAQLQQHVQLTSQMCILCLNDLGYRELVEQSKKILIELDALQRISPAKQQSVYRASPLHEAVVLITGLTAQDWTKLKPSSTEQKALKNPHYPYRHPLRNKQCTAFLNSPVFMYSNLLPEKGMLVSKCVDRRPMFRPSEDMLIAMALEQLSSLKLKSVYNVISDVWIPCRDSFKIRKRVLNASATNTPDSPLVYYKKHKVAPPCECRMVPLQPVAPRNQPPETLPKFFRKYLNQTASVPEPKTRGRRKRSRSTSSSPKHGCQKRAKLSGSASGAQSAPNSSGSEDDETDSEPLDLAHLFRLHEWSSRLKTPEKKAAEKTTSEKTMPERTPEKTPTKKTTPEKRSPMNILKDFVPIAPKPVAASPAESSPVLSPLVRKSMRRRKRRVPQPSPKKALIFPKTYTMDHKSISPTKRAALNVVKKAQHAYQRSSPIKIALPPRNWASYAKSLGRVGGPVTRTSGRRPAPHSSQPAPGSAPATQQGQAAGRAKSKDPTPAAAQDDVENEQSDDMLDDASKDEEGDDMFHLDQLMAASTTIQFDPRKGHGSSSASRPSRNQRRKDLKLTLLSEDIMEMDPKRDDRDTAIAKEYIGRVRQALKSDLDLYMTFLKKMTEFGQGKLTAVELHDCVKTLLKDYPDLVEGFSAFLHPGQAVQCNCFTPNIEFNQARTFLRKLELCFERQPSQFQRILKVFSDWQSNQKKNADELRDLLRPFLRHIPDVADELSSFFAKERPPEYLMSEFETMVLDDEALASKDVEEMEEIEFPDDKDPYRTTRCPCRCHDDITDEKRHQRVKHCLKCSLKVIYGKLFFQFSKKRLVPASITYFDLPPDLEGPENTREGGGSSPREEHDPTPHDPTPGCTTPTTPKRSLKRMKLKLSGVGSKGKRFVSLKEVLVSPSKDSDQSTQRKSSENEAVPNPCARVITEAIPQCSGSPSELEMQPTALSDDTVSCQGDEAMESDPTTESEMGSSVSQSPSTTRPTPVCSSSSGIPSVPPVILRVEQAADGTKTVYVAESSWAGSPPTRSAAQTSVPGSFKTATVQSASVDSLLSSPSKSLDGSDLLAKALRHAQIKQSDAEVSMDGSLSGMLFQHPEAQVVLPLQSVFSAQRGGACSALPAGTVASSAQVFATTPSVGTVPLETENLAASSVVGQAKASAETPDAKSSGAPAPTPGPVWTRDIDKVILETCKAKGIQPDTFGELEQKLPGLTAAQLEKRLHELLAILAETEDV